MSKNSQDCAEKYKRTFQERRHLNLPVFVYGTLMADYGNHVLMRGATFKGNAIVNGFTLRGSGSIPFAIPAVSDNTSILGEIWQFSEKDFADSIRRLDALEGEGSLYYRYEVFARILGQPLPTLCWFYASKPIPGVQYTDTFSDYKQYMANATWRKR